MYSSMPISMEVIKVTSSINLEKKRDYFFLLFHASSQNKCQTSFKLGPHLRRKHIRISIGRLCANRDINISPVMCVLMLIFSEDIVKISIRRSVIGWQSFTYIYAFAYANMSPMDRTTS